LGKQAAPAAIPEGYYVLAIEMRILQIKIALVLAITSGLAIAQAAKGSASALEIVAVKRNRLDVKLRNIWQYPVAIMVSDTPEGRVNRFNYGGYSIEVLERGKWTQLKPRNGIVWGDLPAKYTEIAPTDTVTLPIIIDPKVLGVHRDMRLRLVVRAWRSETNLIDNTRPIRKDSFSLTSASFLWDEKPSK
jgi:hypothetical protein